jgi:hypothetical protein
MWAPFAGTAIGEAFPVLAGALILARAVDEEAFSRQILETAAKRLKRAERSPTSSRAC